MVIGNELNSFVALSETRRRARRMRFINNTHISARRISKKLKSMMKKCRAMLSAIY